MTAQIKGQLGMVAGSLLMIMGPLIFAKPYSHLLTLVGFVVICFSFYSTICLKKKKDQTGVLQANQNYKKRGFRTGVIVAIAACASGPFLLRSEVSGLPALVYWFIPILVFCLIVGISWYLVFKKNP